MSIIMPAVILFLVVVLIVLALQIGRALKREERMLEIVKKSYQEMMK